MRYVRNKQPQLVYAVHVLNNVRSYTSVHSKDLNTCLKELRINASENHDMYLKKRSGK